MYVERSMCIGEDNVQERAVCEEVYVYGRGQVYRRNECEEHYLYSRC